MTIGRIFSPIGRSVRNRRRSTRLPSAATIACSSSSGDIATAARLVRGNAEGFDDEMKADLVDQILSVMPP
jgi:hypothetical protein